MRRSDSYLSSLTHTHIQFLYRTYKHTFAVSANRKYTYLRSSPFYLGSGVDHVLGEKREMGRSSMLMCMGL